MLNRPPTRIELRLEDDLIDLEESIKLRLIKTKNINNILNTNIEFNQSDSKSKNEENEINFFNQRDRFSFSSEKKEVLNFEYNNTNVFNISPNLQRGQKSNGSQITRLNVISKFISEEGEDDLEDGVESTVNNNNNSYGKVSRNNGSGITDFSMR